MLRSRLRRLLWLALWIHLGPPVAHSAPVPGISTVFLVVMENHDWDTIAGSDYCRFINQTMLVQGAHARAYFNPPGLHPSEPNYLWLVAGTNFGVLNDKLPAVNTQRTTNHLAWLLDRAGIPWKAYVEDIRGRDIPLANDGVYAPRHVPFLFFENINTNLAYVTNHLRPFGELARDLADDTVPRFCFLTPNLTNDMHNTTPGSPSTRLQGDNWLAKVVPTITNSAAYQRGGLLLLAWDEGEASKSDGPIGLVLMSPRILRPGLASDVHHDHSDTLRAVQDILGVQPYLGAAAAAAGLDEFFRHLRLEDAGLDATGRHLLLRDALPGRRYRLETRPDTLEGPWDARSTVVAGDGPTPFLDPTPSSQGAFYRVQELP